MMPTAKHRSNTKRSYSSERTKSKIPTSKNKLRSRASRQFVLRRAERLLEKVQLRSGTFVTDEREESDHEQQVQSDSVLFENERETALRKARSRLKGYRLGPRARNRREAWRRVKGPSNEDLMPVYRQINHAPAYDPNQSDSDDDSSSLNRPISDEMPYHLGYQGARVRNKNAARSLEPEPGGAKLVTFFRNGDSNFKGFTTSISHKKFATYETLLIWLNEKIPTTAGVRHVFAIPEGYEVGDVNDFQNGKSYVVSATGRLNTSVVYGYSKENYWHNRKMSGGKNRRPDRRLMRFRENSDDSGTILPTPQGMSPVQNRPRVFTLISNSHRGSREKVILNPSTQQTFEEILHDCTNIIKMSNPPVQALYTARPPFKRVHSISQLMRDFKNHDTFIACGMELKPFEVRKRAENNSERSDRSDSPSSSRDPDQVEHQRTFDKPNDVAHLTVDDYSSNKPINHHPSSHSNNHPSNNPARHSRNTNYREEPAPYENNNMALVPVADNTPRSYGTKNYTSPRGIGRGMDGPALTPLPKIQGGIDTRRYRGDAYNQPEKGKKVIKDGTKEDRVNVVRVDIHGKRREFFAPTEPHPNDDGGPPDRSLQVDWIYGYRGKDARNSPRILRTGEIAYFISNFVVIYDRHRDKQRHYVEHNEDILCMDVHSRLGFVATGQGASPGKGPTRQAHIRVWDYRSLTTYMVLGEGAFSKGVCAVSFSHDSGIYLLAVDLSNKHVMTVWDWENNQVLAKTTTSPDTVLGAHFHPTDESVLVTHGKQHISFWKIFWDATDNNGQQQGRVLRDKKSGVIEGEPPQAITSLTFTPSGDVLTGDTNGCIMIWSRDHNNAFVRDHEFGQELKFAHQKPVLTLCLMTDGTLLSGGGSQIKAWDNDFRLIKERMIPEVCGNIRTIIPQSFEGNDGNLYVGTTNNIILEGSLQEKFTNIVQGHSDELWGLITHPKEHTFFTSSHDAYVMKWSANTHRTVWKANVEKPSLSISMDSKCSILAVGTAGGRLVILDAHTGMHMCSLQVSADNLGVVSFSPNGELLAVGSHDNTIYVYSVLDDGQCLRRHHSGVLTGHRNFITHVDWSADGRYLQSVSGDYDLRYWNIDQMVLEKSSNIFCEMDWATQTCIIGHPVLGAWSNLGKGEDIDAVARSNRSDLMVVGENKGFLRMYKYPCSTHKAEYAAVKPYSSHVTNVQFTFDDAFLVSTGGTDCTVIQWALVEPRDQPGDTAS